MDRAGLSKAAGEEPQTARADACGTDTPHGLSASDTAGTSPPHARSLSRRDLATACSAAALGMVVLAFLFRYNHQHNAVWAAGPYAPLRSWEEYLLVNVAALIFPPLLLLLLVLRRPAAAFGLRAPARGSGGVAWLFLAAMAPVVWIASLQPQFRAFYPLQPQAAWSWGYFLYFELTYGFYLFCWEFFFRGFLTFGMARGFGTTAAIALQAVGFGIMHIGKPIPEVVGSFVGGAALGWLALRARSFVPGFGVHWAIAIALDCLAIHARSHAIL